MQVFRKRTSGCLIRPTAVFTKVLHNIGSLSEVDSAQSHCVLQMQTGYRYSQCHITHMVECAVGPWELLKS